MCADMPLGRGIIGETEKAYLCAENIWWPKSQATLFHDLLVVTPWIWERKHKERKRVDAFKPET